MKKILVTCILSAALALSCAAQKKGSVSYSSNENGNTHSYTYNDDKDRLEIKYRGEISFNESETAVQTISGDGYLSYKKNGKKISISPAANGAIAYEINGGDKKSSLNPEETTFLADAIKTLIQHGVGAKDRVERIYKKSGTVAVLDEVNVMKGDYVKSIYLGYLIRTNSLSENELTGIAKKIGTIIESDFEKGKLLGEFSEKYLSNEKTADAYLDAVKSIGSDFEKANAVKNILQQPLTASQFTKVLSLTKNIGSDFEKANVLKEVLSNNKISPEQFSEVLKTTASVGSDFEKGNILKDILANNKLPATQFNETLDVIASIGSDFEKANVLKQVAEQKITGDEQWLNLIGKTERISSDFEKGNVLVSFASKMPQTKEVRAAYMKAAKTISSDYEYGRVVRAIEKKEI